VFAVPLSACSIPVWRDRPVRSWSQATGGEQLERLFWNNVKEKNWTELQRHISNTFVALTAAGRFDREQALAHLKRLDIKDYSLTQCEVQPSGPDLTVTCTLALRGASDAAPIPPPARIMTVWQHGDHGWMAIAHTRFPLTSQ
jgi:hypothetical protein